MSVSIQIDIHGTNEFQKTLKKFDAQIQQQVRTWLNKWAQKVASQAKANAPERTGYLKSTIYAAVQEWTTQIGAEAVYSYFVEFGTRYMQSHPFLYPAPQEFLPELETYIINALQQAKTEASL